MYVYWAVIGNVVIVLINCASTQEITMADLFHLPYGALLPRIGYTVLETGANDTPNVARWWKDITSRPAWLAVKDGVPSAGLKA